MTVAELIAELKKYPQDWDVHLDIDADEEERVIGVDEIGLPEIMPAGWEGDRVVRHVAGVRIQQGYLAVAIDGMSCDETNKKGMPLNEEDL